MTAWPELPLEDALDELIDYRGKSPKKSDTGIPVISAKVVKDGRVIEPIEQTISPDYYSDWMRRGLPLVGDVVMTTEGPLGEVARLDAKTASYALGQRIVTLRGKSNILDNGFLKYLLMSRPIQERLHGRATGSTVAGISQKALREMLIPIAPLSEQREIAGILGALDDKIEMNRKTAATLEAMARALYRSWFVDFDPVWARLEGRAPAHMDSATAALFPDRFTDDGLPEGWRMGSLGDLITFNPKEVLKKGVEAPYLDMRALPTSGLMPDPAILREFSSGTKFRAGDTLLARITPCLENGKTAMVDDLGPDVVGWGSTEFIVMRAKDDVLSALPYCIARDGAFRLEAIATMTGSSGRQRADEKRIADLPLAIPTPPVLNAFGALTGPWIRMAQHLGRQSQTLASLRDSLLPRLMSGELRVLEARDRVEEVA